MGCSCCWFNSWSEQIVFIIYVQLSCPNLPWGVIKVFKNYNLSIFSFKDKDEKSFASSFIYFLGNGVAEIPQWQFLLASFKSFLSRYPWRQTASPEGSVIVSCYSSAFLVWSFSSGLEGQQFLQSGTNSAEQEPKWSKTACLGVYYFKALAALGVETLKHYVDVGFSYWSYF